MRLVLLAALLASCAGKDGDSGVAKTETTFLRERLAEIRGERDQLKERVGDLGRPSPEATAPPPSVPAPAQPLWRRILGELRSRPKW